MSALDLDALERLTRAYADAHAAMLADDRSAQAWLDDEAASKALAAHYGGQWASPAQCVDVLALITRLRAAEARTAWQPIETAPPREEGALGPWAQVWGVRFGRRKPDVHLARLDGIGWGDRDGNSVRPLLWAPAMDAPLPAASEAP